MPGAQSTRGCASIIRPGLVNEVKPDNLKAVTDFAREPGNYPLCVCWMRFSASGRGAFRSLSQ